MGQGGDFNKKDLLGTYLLNIVFYFQVHQPFRLKKLNVFNVGEIDSPFDEGLNRAIIKKVAEKCYIPANKLLLELINMNANILWTFSGS